ncbi:Tetratricopeptide repeat-containing domain [Macleaya cordata]|uniref:Tetratricopeptide repeat-containing domain n=1 Tax=Macleaya cordata TaxID=56857 RepID=A0A200RAU3_MACCD|nr:Tetratricopeptide repeat-containing domain [Macleaya cordata]
MMQDLWNAPPPGFRPSKSAPSSPVKPLGVARTRSESFHVTYKVPVGDTPYVRAKNVQLVEKDPEKAIPLFWAAINAGDRVDSALKDMAIVMKQQNRAEEAIEAIKSLRSRCSDQAQESLDNILLDLYKRCGRLDDQIALLKHKLYLIQQGMAFNGKRTKTARSQGKKFQVSVEQEATRLLGNLGWAFMQQNNYIEAEDAYRRALLIATDNNKMCNLGICLMKQGRIAEAKETLRRVRPAIADGPRGVDSHLKAFERAQQMLLDLESEMMNKVVDRVEQGRLFDAFLGSSSIWQPQPCKEPALPSSVVVSLTKPRDGFADENVDSLARTRNQVVNNPPIQKNTKSVMGNQVVNPPLQKITKPVAGQSKNSFNVAAPPFYSSQLLTDPSVTQFHDPLGGGLKRTRSVNNAASQPIKDESRYNPTVVAREQSEQNKTRRRSLPIEEDNAELLPDKAFEEAIIAAVLGPTNEMAKTAETSHNSMMHQRKIDKRLRVFQDITLSLSPRA